MRPVTLRPLPNGSAIDLSACPTATSAGSVTEPPPTVCTVTRSPSPTPSSLAVPVEISAALPQTILYIGSGFSCVHALLA